MWFIIAIIAIMRKPLDAVGRILTTTKAVAFIRYTDPVEGRLYM